MPKIIKNCIVCNNSFSVFPSAAARRVTCSRSCNVIWQKTAQKGENNGNWKGGASYELKSVCESCKNEFTFISDRKNRKRKFCSISCSNSSRKSDLKSNCLNCGKEVNSIPSRPRKYCNQACKYEHMKGENSTSWKGGNVELNCLNCGCSYEVKPVHKNISKYCSIPCRDMFNQKKVSCTWCGCDVIKPKSRADAYEHSFCSDEHRILWLNTEKEGPSLAELKTADILRELNIEFEFQKPVGPYLLDFALPGKIDLEIDSEYHHNLPGRPEKDKRRDKYTTGQGWRVIRIPSQAVSKESISMLLGCK